MHMRLRHNDCHRLNIVCSLDGCEFSFNTVESFRKHVRIQHALHWNRKQVSVVNSSDVELQDAGENTEFNFENNLNSHEDLLVEYNSYLGAMSSHIATTKLRAREMFLLPKSVATSIFEDIQGFMDLYQINTNYLLRNRLQQLGVDYENDQVLKSILTDNSVFEEVTRSFKSEHLFKKYVTDHLSYIAPIEFILTDTNVEKEAKNKKNCYNGEPGNKEPMKDVVHYVPILKVLKHYLEHEDVWASCQQQNKKNESSQQLRDYTDGNFWKLQNICHENFIRIHLYTDELEICNPLGSKKMVHKICAFYFFVGNIEVKHRSTLSNIHLALLCKYSVVKKYGYKRILEPLINDINILENEGIILDIEGINRHLYGSVMTMSGDNLSSHAIGGFSMSFSSGRVCRHCMISHISLSNASSENDVIIRTRTNHQYHVRSIKKDADLKAVYGVKDECALTGLAYFDAISGLPPDAMHDILEGLMVVNIQVTVRGLCKSKVINLTGPECGYRKLQVHRK